MKLTINIEGVEREYQGDYDELHNMDWTGRIRDLLDDAKEYDDERQNKILQGDH